MTLVMVLFYRVYGPQRGHWPLKFCYTRRDAALEPAFEDMGHLVTPPPLR